VQAAAQEDDFARIDAPIVGADGSLESTTGEVNLYYDPWTFGTASPRLYVDCEGLGGTKPKASSHQRQWSSSVLSHQIRHQRGVPIDRKWAVTKLYPKFVYIFSDVVCYVTRNTKGWPVVVDNLLRWAMVAAQHAVNQYALPAAIIVLNGTYDGQPEWVDGNPEYLTRRFFRIVENMMEDKYIQSVAEQVCELASALNRMLITSTVQSGQRRGDPQTMLFYYSRHLCAVEELSATRDRGNTFQAVWQAT
jgi:hypothetical protein